MPKQNTAPSHFPQAVLQQIEQLGQHIAIARKRRRESQAQWAKRLGVSQPTMARIERGDPAVSMAFYVMAMWLINQAEGLADLIAPQHDVAALDKEVSKVRSLVAKPRKPATQSAPPLLASAAEPGPHSALLGVSEPSVMPVPARSTADQRPLSAQLGLNTRLAAANKPNSLLARAAALAAEQQQGGIAAQPGLEGESP